MKKKLINISYCIFLSIILSPQVIKADDLFDLGKKIFLEIYIFGLKKNLYKTKLRVYFLKFLRKDLKFDSQIQLIKQMNKDEILTNFRKRIKNEIKSFSGNYSE